MQDKVTYGIHAKEVYKFIGIKHISFGLAHLAIALDQPRMTKYLLWKRQVKCHQKDRPINGMETDDIFTDQMQVCRPVLFEKVRRIAVAVITDTGDIVGKGI